MWHACVLWMYVAGNGVKIIWCYLNDREVGKPVRDGWFRWKLIEFRKETYLQLPPHFFVFSRQWFREFLARHRIVLRLVTNIAQSLLANYKELLLVWLRVNRDNRILTPLFHPRSALTPPCFNLCFICNDNEGGIPDDRICNVNETPLPWQYLMGQTCHMKGAKTVWSKSEESGAEKRQCTLFLCIFGDGVPQVPPILIFTATTGVNIGKKKHTCRINGPTLNSHQLDGWMRNYS